jgi:hypothetical protein
MRKRLIATLIAFCPMFLIHSQQSYYFGVRSEISLIQPRLSQPTNINTPIAIGGGISWVYPFSQQWEMTVDALASIYAYNADARMYGSNGLEKIGNQSMNITSFDFTYTLLRGFGDEQHFKLGGGIFYGLMLPPTIGTNTNKYWGNAIEVDQNYDLEKILRQTGNFGVALEAIYNINDALQISLRYRLGLVNLNNQDTPSWQQNALGLNAIYYFGADKRGSIKESSSKKNGKKYKW